MRMSAADSLVSLSISLNLILPKGMRSNLFLAASFVLLVAVLVSVHVPAKNSMSSYLKNQQSLEEKVEVFPLPGGAIGPESFAFRGGGGGSDPYTGVSDGRIIKWQGNESRWVNFAVTSPHRSGCEGSDGHSKREHICGRPLGLCFNEKTGDLYIADAYMGLSVVGSNGGLAKQLVREAQGVPLRFTNSLDIDQNTGVVYFTDSSTNFQRRNYVSLILSGDKSGRLLKYDPRSNDVQVLLHNLNFPNGVSLSKSADFILIAETTPCRILKFWLHNNNNTNSNPPKLITSESAGNSAAGVEVLAQLPGFPDNIKRNKKGEFWVAINSRRGKFLKWILSIDQWLRNKFVTWLMTWTVDYDDHDQDIITNAYSYFGEYFGGSSLALKLDENGDVLEENKFGVLNGKGNNKKNKRWKHVSEICEEGKSGQLWIGSFKNPYALKLKVSDH